MFGNVIYSCGGKAVFQQQLHQLGAQLSSITIDAQLWIIVLIIIHVEKVMWIKWLFFSGRKISSIYLKYKYFVTFHF